MGRKSRYKKYKAVDPFCTGQRKDLLLRHENVFNKAPSKEDFEQKPPKGFLELMDSLKHSKGKASQRGKKRKSEGNVEKSTGNKKQTKYERHTWESDDQYLGRVDRMVTNIVTREKMEILKSGGDQDMPAKKLTKEKERKMKRIKKTAAEAKKRKIEEQKEYTKAVKNEQMLDTLEQDMMKDEVEFGEVAMEPPVLTKAPRKSQDRAKPGQRELLLKGIMCGKTPSTQKSQQTKAAPPKQKKSGIAKKAGKRRKDMSALEKMRFDQTRNEVIAAYRKHRDTERPVLPTEESLIDDAT